MTRHHPQLEPRWQAGAQVRWRLGPWERDWLLDTGSLTKRLIKASKGDFRVEIQRQTMSAVYNSEAQLLGIPLQQQALVREVILMGAGKPWVFARSVIPHSTLTGRLRSLSKLDNRPLGALLFQDPHMERGGIEVAQIKSRDRFLPSSLQSTNSTFWGRRSLFFLSQKPILVNEVFLDRPDA